MFPGVGEHRPRFGAETYQRWHTRTRWLASQGLHTELELRESTFLFRQPAHPTSERHILALEAGIETCGEMGTGAIPAPQCPQGQEQ